MKPGDVAAWFSERGWKPFAFQRDVWKAVSEGRSGLLHATTGAGKTYALWFAALLALSEGTRGRKRRTTSEGVEPKPLAAPLQLLWITPMRALAADTLRAMQAPLESLAPHWQAGARSGDTTSAERSAQDKRLPTALVTTPESLSLMLSRADAQEQLKSVRMVVVDEWHELMGNKRGVQVQLALARLRHWHPGLVVWGMSATLGNLPDALRTLLGPGAEGVLVRGETPKKLIVDSLLPSRAERFPWGGHLGVTMLPQVVEEIAASSTTLVFTNTRSQAEIWYSALLDARPEWAGEIALHHGSLDRAVREWVELALKKGSLRAVVCTSSLDLGVDFLPVERVLQIGSAKGIARLLQRAGRSGHAPGRPSRITLVPTHSIEIVEGAAAREAIAAGQIEARYSPHQPLDVLVQHLVTVALGGGFVPDALFDEVRGTAAYASLSREHWQWCLDFVSRGGPSLVAYPDFKRVVPDDEGVWRVPDARLARRHRMNIGTIVSDASISVQYMSGGRIGSVEESFVARLKPGGCFLFGGRLLELVRIHDMTALVRRATGKRAAVPRWGGGRMAFTSTLGDAVVQQLARAGRGIYDSPELQSLRPLLELQQKWSALPSMEHLLVETLKTREGWHLFVYPFAGRPVHLGLASLLAWRIAQHEPRTFSIGFNDYGFELLSAVEVDWARLLPLALQMPHGPADSHTELLHEVLASLNASELARRRFREIARVSGLIFQGYPGEKRSNRQLQASSSLFFEVFKKYDPGNRLLAQAEGELLAQELEIGRLQQSLERMNSQTLVLQAIERPTPFSFPLMVEIFREQLSNEKLSDRIARMVAQLEKAAGGSVSVGHVDDVRESLVFGASGAN